MISKILLVLFFCIAPAVVLWLCKKVPFFGKIGPILILYILGVVIGNLPWINEGSYELKDTITTILIPLALPMMLFACAITRESLKGVFRSLIAGHHLPEINLFAGFQRLISIQSIQIFPLNHL